MTISLIKVTDLTAPGRCGDCGRPPSARGGFIATIKYLYYCPGFFDPRGRCTEIKVAKLPNFLTFVLLRSRKYNSVQVVLLGRISKYELKDAY